MSAKKNKQIPLKPAQGASWEVKSRATHCLETEAEFTEGEVICSRLVVTQEGWERQDFSKQAWNQEKQEESLFYWQTKFRLPPPKKEEPFKEENAEEFLREFVEKNDPEAVNTVFILAVMLERKRILIEQGLQRDPDGKPVRIYEHKDSGETFFILDPELALDQIADVQMDVAKTLGWIQEEEPPTDEEAGEEGEEGDEMSTPDEEAEDEEAESFEKDEPDDPGEEEDEFADEFDDEEEFEEEDEFDEEEDEE